MTDIPNVRVGDGSGNEQYRTCAECGGEGVGIRSAFSCSEHGLHGVTDPFERTR
ncbi:hypothetical protein [Leucobacter alluvii]|uniref:hypothetical protein n=1 Tax=Leucobacter alluvii TaxID=340321 RepID=UPI0031F9C63F